MFGSGKQKREGYLPLRGPPPTAPVNPLGATRPVPHIIVPRRTSPGTEQRRTSGTSSQARNLLPIQVPQTMRQKDKVVMLPEPGQLLPDALLPELAAKPTTIFEDLEESPAPARGRITVYCFAESLDRKILEQLLQQQHKPEMMHSYPEVVHLQISPQGGVAGDKGDIFFFDYGVVVLWGLSKVAEQDALRDVAAKAAQNPLPVNDVEVDEFQFNYSNEPPHMSNDIITINRIQGNDHTVKLAISHALAQSTKLSVYELRVVDIVRESKDLPEALARHGTVHISQKRVAQLIGKVFLQRSSVNLISSVLGTPEFFWSAPDSLQQLYERVCDYLELETRVEVLNARFEVLQEMLDMLRDHQNHAHTARLEWIIIWLIAIELVVGLFQLMGLFGVVGHADGSKGVGTPTPIPLPLAPPGPAM